jgi:hypothetical protein
MIKGKSIKHENSGTVGVGVEVRVGLKVGVGRFVGS